MKTLNAILDDAKRFRIPCTERTFWKYYKLGLLPEGRKIPGKGNVVFFPNDTLLRLWLIAFMKEEMNSSLADISHCPLPEFDIGDGDLPPNIWTGDFLLKAKRECQKAKREAMLTVINELVKALESEKNANYQADDRTWDQPKGLHVFNFDAVF